MSEYCEYSWGMRDKSFGLSSATKNGNVGNKKTSPQHIYNEPTEMNQALHQLKELIGASMDYALKDKSCCQDDEFLTRFLFARKFDVAEAFKLIINYHSFRQKNGILLQRLSALDESIQLALRDGYPGVLKERDRRGRKVLVFFTANWDTSLYSLITVYRAMLLSLEKLLEDKQNQANGFVAIVDWTNFTLRQSSHLNPKVLKLMIEGLQDCFPVQFKAIHFIGQPWYVEAAMAVIKPFLKEKTRARIKLHGGNLSTLHDCIARDILPAELGGEGPSFNALDWVHQLLDASQVVTYDKAAKSYHFTQTTVYSQPPPEYSKVVLQMKQEQEEAENEADEKCIKDKTGLKLIETVGSGEALNGNGKEKNNNSFISNFNRTNGNGKLKPGDPARNSLLNIDEF